MNKVCQSHLLPNMTAQKLQDFFFILKIETSEDVLRNLVNLEKMVKNETKQKITTS